MFSDVCWIVSDSGKHHFVGICRTLSLFLTLLFFGGTVLLCVFFLGTFERIVNYVMVFDTLNNATVAATIFVLRRRGVVSQNGKAYQVPFYPYLPAFFVLFLLFITVNVIATQPASILVGGAILLAGYPVFLILRRVSSNETSARRPNS